MLKLTFQFHMLFHMVVSHVKINIFFSHAVSHAQLEIKRFALDFSDFYYFTLFTDIFYYYTLFTENSLIKIRKI